MNKLDIASIGKEVLEIEASSIKALSSSINQVFESAVNQLISCQGRVIVTGMGKSGHIGKKIAATLASTGTPAFFVHPAEASHGDLGMITQNDVIIALSYSGETNEVLAILPMIKRFNITLISMTGNSNSTLAKTSDMHLSVAVKKEACPHGLAPTSSTTATLAMGDALAIATLKCRGFTADDFALSHPGGTLGKRLLIQVKDLMHTGNTIPKVNSTASLNTALTEMTNKNLGVTAIIDENGSLLGVFSDGDIRRALGVVKDIENTSINEVMTTGGKTIDKNELAASALSIMEESQITSLFIMDNDKKIEGIIHLHDLLKAGIA